MQSHIETVTFSASSSESFNNVFSASYENYRIVCYLEASAITTLRVRLRVGGSDNSTASSYIHQALGSGGGSTASQNLVSDKWSEFIYINASSEINSFVLDLQKPFLAAQTAGQQIGGRGNNLSIGQLRHNQSTSYDGFTIFPSAGNITGKVAIYGYKF